MHIGLDYDGTITADPDLFTAFVKLAKARGHKVSVITMRHDDVKEHLPQELCQSVDAVIYTGRMAKVPFMEQRGIKVDIWIDDSPHWLLQNSR